MPDMTEKHAAPPESPKSETGRIEAFSDGVIAIIITIMVLELRPPHEATLAGLLELWPVMAAYALSFAQVGIYWNNHHALFEIASIASNRLRWANMLWLFCLSLIPFGTAYWGEHPAQPIPTAFYLFTLLLPALVYPWLEVEALCHAAPGDTASQHRVQQRKSLASLGLYALGIALAFVFAPASLVCVLVVGVIWIMPGGRLDRWFARD